ncbi:MAG: hypothetical protein R6V01_07560 [Thermoplasmatota archaeon]
METLWIVPLRIVPVVSFQKLLKGEMKNPSTGLDRLNLTDVGEAVYGNMTGAGTRVKFKGVKNPFPWEMVFRMKNEQKVSLTGVMIENSTFRSIFKLMFIPEKEVRELIKRSISTIDRDLLVSPYWDSGTWDRFSSLAKLSREQVIQNNENIVSSL